MKDRTTQTKTVTIILRDDGILNVRTIRGVDQNEEDARENLEICRQLLAGRSSPILVDIRETGVLDKRARKAYAREADFALAQAMLVGSAFTRISANLFIRVARPIHPTMMFTCEDEAIKWLKGFLA